MNSSPTKFSSPETRFERAVFPVLLAISKQQRIEPGEIEPPYYERALKVFKDNKEKVQEIFKQLNVEVRATNEPVHELLSPQYGDEVNEMGRMLESIRAQLATGAGEVEQTTDRDHDGDVAMSEEPGELPDHVGQEQLS